MRRRPFYRPDSHRGCISNASSGCDLNLFVVSSVVCNVVTDKLVCNERKSVLSESVLAVLSYIEINSTSISVYLNKSPLMLADPRDTVPQAHRVVHRCRWSL